MTKFGTAVAALSAVATALLSTTALSQDWVINKVSGKVSVGAAGSPARTLAAGMSVPQGSTITTGANARAMLIRGSETLVVGPNSAIAIQPGQGGLTTTVLQKSGQLTVDVETKQAPHFSVETPFMAAVVKGTKFDVRVSRSDASVAVQRGRVQVADFATGQTADITPGQRASVRQGGRPGLNLSGKGPRPAVQSGAPRPAVVTPAGAAAGQTAAATAAPAAAAAPVAAASFSNSAGFGPGRSWSGPASSDDKGRDGVKGAAGNAAATSKSVSADGSPGRSGQSSSAGKSGLSSSLNSVLSSGPGNSGKSDSPGNSGKSGNSGNSGLLSTVGSSVASSGPGNSGKSGSPGNSGKGGPNGVGGGKGLLGR